MSGRAGLPPLSSGTGTGGSRGPIRPDSHPAGQLQTSPARHSANAASGVVGRHEIRRLREALAVAPAWRPAVRVI